MLEIKCQFWTATDRLIKAILHFRENRVLTQTESIMSIHTILHAIGHCHTELIDHNFFDTIGTFLTILPIPFTFKKNSCKNYNKCDFPHSNGLLTSTQ